MYRRNLLLGGIGAALGVTGLSARAQPAAGDESTYPSRTVTIACGFAVGGPTDAVTRLLADLLTKHFNQSFVVETRLGANGAVAGLFVKNARPDGYTLLMGGSGPLVVGPHINDNLPYDSLKDFVAVAPVSNYPYFLVVPADSPIKSVQDLIARARTGKLTYASAGIGASNHLAVEWIKAATGIDAVHVPYKGDAAAMTDVLSGRVDFSILSGVVIDAHVKSGRLRILGVTSLRPDRSVGGAPLIADAGGIADFAVEPWTGIFGPAGLSPLIVTKLAAAINTVMASQEARDRLAAIGQFPFTGSTDEFRKYIALEYARWGKVISQAKIAKSSF